MTAAEALAATRPERAAARSAGELTWAAAAVAAAGVFALALADRQPEVFLAAAACIAFVLLFAVRPMLGTFAVLLVRPSLDLWADRSLAGVGGADLNPASLLALVLILVGGAYVVERLADARRAPAFTPMVALAVIAGLGIAVAASKGAAMTEWLRLVSIVVTYALAYLAVRDRRSLGRLVLVLLVSAVPPVVAGIWQTAHGGNVEIDGIGRATGTFLHPNPFAIYLALMILLAVPLALGRVRGWAVALLVAAPFAAVALVGSYTRTAWLGVFAGLLLIGAIRYRVLLLLAPVGLIAVAVAVPGTAQRFNDLDEGPTEYGSGNSFATRVDFWQESLPDARRNPVLGKGLSGIQEESAAGFNVHSDYVRTLVETGVFGFAAYLWVLAATLIGAVRSLRAVGPRGDPFAYAVALGGVTAASAFILASADSNLLTQVAVAGTAWAAFAAAHAAGRVAPGPAPEPLFAPVWRPRRTRGAGAPAAADA